MIANRQGRDVYWRRQPPVVAGILMAVAAGTFAVASIVHFGVDIPVGFTTIRDSFPGAATPEAVIAVAVAIGATAVLIRRRKSRGIALGITSLAIVGTVYGLTVTLDSTRTGDIAYHVGILAALLIVLSLLLVPGGSDVTPARDVRNEMAS